MPATGDSLQIVYSMAKPGSAELDVFNERGDLAAKLRDSKVSGVQASRLDLIGFSAGVYFYRLFLRYDDGSSQALPPGKIVRIR